MKEPVPGRYACCEIPEAYFEIDCKTGKKKWLTPHFRELFYLM